LRLGKRRTDGACDEETPVARKKVKPSEYVIQVSRKEIDATQPRLPVSPPCTVNAQQARSTVKTDIDGSMHADFPASGRVGIRTNVITSTTKATAPGFESSLFLRPDVSNTNPERPDINTSSATGPAGLRDSAPMLPCMEPSSSIGSTAKSLMIKRSQTSRTVMPRRKSVSVVSHQRALKYSARRVKPLMMTMPEKALHVVAPDTSSITTPASTPIDVSKKHSATDAIACSSTTGTRVSQAILPTGSKSAVHICGESGVRPLTLRSAPRKRQGPAKKQAKQKPPMVTPMEYAEILAAKCSGPCKKVKKHASQYLRGKHIFYTEGDLNFAGESTRKKMEIVSNIYAILRLDSQLLVLATDRQTRWHPCI
jgi:hypothetical protein